MKLESSFQKRIEENGELFLHLSFSVSYEVLKVRRGKGMSSGFEVKTVEHDDFDGEQIFEVLRHELYKVDYRGVSHTT